MNEFIYNYKSKKICLVASHRDSASLTIAKEVESLGFNVFYLTDNSHLYCRKEDLPDSDFYIIMSRHTSSTATPAITVHSVGNFSSDEPKFGGLPSSLSYTDADLQSELLRCISYEKTNKSEFKKFDVVAEVTHHGPFLNTPLGYIEMGSSPDVWNNSSCGNILASAIVNLVSNKYSQNYKQVEKSGIAFGGPHYAYKFTKLILNEEYNIGHIAAKYSLLSLNHDTIKQMIDKMLSKNKIEYAILEKKGMKRKQEIKNILNEMNLEIIQI